MKKLEKKPLKKMVAKPDKEKVMLYSTEGNSCANQPYSANCTC